MNILSSKLFAVCLIFCTPLFADSTLFNLSETLILADAGSTYTVPADKIWVLQFVSTPPFGSGDAINVNSKSIVEVDTPNLGLPLYLASGATIQVLKNGVSAGIAVFDKPSADPFSPSVPANAVVIPENASGTFRVVLESSVDLITWTEATPGYYGSSEARRFFRTRVIHP